MEETQISRTLNVQERVIERLSEEVQYRESFQYIVSTTKSDIFWSRVDELPLVLSAELHSLEASIPCKTHDFPYSSLSPLFQDFYMANILSHEEKPSIPSCSAYFSFGGEAVDEILSKINGWEKIDGVWNCESIPFDIKSLCYMFDSYCMVLKPWLFCPIPEIRSSYIECDKILHNTDTKYDFSKVYEKMRNFEYASKDSLSEDINSLTSHKLIDNINDFNIPPSICTCLSTAMHFSLDLHKSRQGRISSFHNDEWTQRVTANLVQQMALPFGERYSLESSQNLKQARACQTTDLSPPKNSLFELLFGTMNDVCVPMPYTGVQVEVPYKSQTEMCKSAIRRFASKQLMTHCRGYKAVSETALEMLVDVSYEFIRDIAKDAMVMKKASSRASAKETLSQVLMNKGFDSRTNSANANFFSWK